MSWVLGGLAALVLLAAVTAVAFYTTAKRNLKYPLAVEVNIRGRWQPRTVYLHFYHWLPRFFRAFDVTLDDHIWLRGGPPERTPPLQGWKAGGKVTQRWQLAHALSHFADQEREDTAGDGTWLSDMVYYWKAGWHRLTHRWANRPEELRANARQGSIAAGTSDVVRSLGLPLWFPDNYQQPGSP